MDEKERPFKSLDLIFDIAREKLQSQSDHWRAIDQKNAIIIAVYGILLAMVATIDKSSLWIIPKCVAGIVFGVWLGLIALGMGCSIASILPKLMGVAANISEISRRFLKAEEYDTKNNLLSTFEDTIIKNEKIIKKKREYLFLSVKVFLPISLSLAIIIILFKILNWRV